ncbi:hypothetical protein [Thermococcus sp. JdF3]|uniref:hypothetical protein n=1 Tax=Thermococcus sp. JdF3 TaxID=1638258 RepID=UPI00143933D2|nr:hypothetical protein [Thermococcus sp. JdF3]NJE00556.1 hypothetical protein [Thermococcus sp. JdF3]
MKLSSVVALAVLLIVLVSALHLHVQRERLDAFIEGQRDCEGSWIHLVTFSTMVDIQFHSKNAIEALNSNSTAVFNLSTVELEGDFLSLLNHLIETADYLELDTFNDSVLVMVDTGPCLDFLNVSRTAFINGTANVSAVREGLNLIHDFATEWRENGDYPSEELLKANAELQRKCGALVPRVVSP